MKRKNALLCNKMYWISILGGRYEKSQRNEIFLTKYEICYLDKS
jgi:hypothetical protein